MAQAKRGLQLHPVRQIVNVQWGALAVDFGPQSSDGEIKNETKK
jgi:hypothetical protein